MVAGKWGLPLSCRRFRRREDRVHAVAPARSERGEAVPAVGILRRWNSVMGAQPRGRHPASASAIAELKQTGELGPALSLPNGNVSEEHHRAGSSIHQKGGSLLASGSIGGGRLSNDRGLR